VAHIRQSTPDSGLGFQTKVCKTFQIGPISLGSGAIAEGFGLRVLGLWFHTGFQGLKPDARPESRITFFTPGVGFDV
jgi:hypothetical protein